jgi:hypothetical protein
MQRIFAGSKRPGREAVHLPSSTAYMKDAWSCATNSLCIFMAQSLVKDTDTLNITLPTPNIEFKSNYFEEMDTFHSIHLKAYSLRRKYSADRIGLWQLVF